jgi:hypothetical protein
VEDVALGQLVVQVVAFTGAFADAGEDREATVLDRDVADQLLNDDRLAHAGAAQDADLAASGERRNQVDDLDAGLEHARLDALLDQRGRQAMDWKVGFGIDLAFAVDRVAEHVQHATERALADRNGDWRAGVVGEQSAPQTVGRAHGHRAHDVVAEGCWTSRTSVRRRRRGRPGRGGSQARTAGRTGRRARGRRCAPVCLR